MTTIENILRQHIHILFRQQSILPKLPHDFRSLLVFWPEAWRNSISVDSSSSDGTLLLLLLKLPVGVTSTGNKQTFFTTLKWITVAYPQEFLTYTVPHYFKFTHCKLVGKIIVLYLYNMPGPKIRPRIKNLYINLINKNDLK